MEKMEVRYLMKVGDLAYARKCLPRSWYWLSFGGAASILGLVMLPASVLLWGPHTSVMVVVSWLFLVVIAIVGVVKLWQSERTQEQRIRNIGEITLNLQPEWIESENEQGWCRRSWHCIESVKATNRHAIIRIKPFMFHIVPLDAFPSIDAAQQFVTQAEKFRQDVASTTPVSLPSLPDNVRARAENSLTQVAFEKSRAELLQLHVTGDIAPNNSGKRRNFSLNFIAVVIMLSAFITYTLMTPTPNRLRTIREESSPSLTTGILIMTISMIVGVVAWRIIIRRMLTAAYTGIPLGHETHTIAKEGILIDGFYSQSWQSWRGVDRISETSNFIVVWQGMAATHVFPKRIFATADDASRFLQLLQHTLENSRLTDESAAYDLGAVKETGNPYQPPKVM